MRDKVFSVVVALIFSSPLFAETNAGTGQKWYGPYTVDRVARYWDGGHRMSVHVKEPMNTSCEVSNQEKKASYYYSAASYDFASDMYSVVVTAQAQNKKIMLLLDSACNPIYGLNVHGVEILTE